MAQHARKEIQGKGPSTKQPGKARFGITAALFLLMLFSPCLLLAQQVGAPSLPVPASLTSKMADYLTGGDSHPGIRESLSLSGFRDGKLQRLTEYAIGKFIPAKYYALLGSSATKRGFIELSNILFNFQTFPTFYGSGMVSLPESDALAQSPAIESEAMIAQLQGLSQGFAAVAQDYPDKHFCLVIVDNSSNAACQTTLDYVSDALTTEEAAYALRSSLGGLGNISVYDDTHESLEDYYHDYYTTDHHWNGWGALHAYNNALTSLETLQGFPVQDLRVDSQPSELQGLDWLKTNGSYCRFGLMLLNASVNEPALDLTMVDTLENKTFFGESQEAPYVLDPDGVVQLHEAGLEKEFDFYQTWYGDPTLTKTSNDTISSSAKALIIGDSFATAFKWIAASRFAETTTLQDFHYSIPEVTALRQSIQETNADVIFVVARVQNILRFADRFPDYFA